jgi:hypothetical protein
MIVRIDFELDDEAQSMLQKAATALSRDDFAFVDAVHAFMEGDSFYDAVFHALAAAVQLDGLERGRNSKRPGG